jgi:hypothetical protein
VKTLVLLAYDDRALYVGIRCDDPEPRKIRAPYVDRDQVLGDQDSVSMFVDARNDRRSAQEFRVNPRGVQTDAIWNDANQREDFSPDFHYATAARITDGGWEAEMRIPFSSLRYSRRDVQEWGILFLRNYPRDFRYLIFSSPLPRGSNCLICHSRELRGLKGLPSAGHVTIAPYATGQAVSRAPTAGDPLVDEPTEADGGVDLKWTPAAAAAIDLTINPDFSQVEADVAQIAVNNRFALFFPEKRPFFLEGVDLLDTPITAVYTRTITSPRWGGRATGKAAASSYTVLVAEDEGGGSVVLPGPTSSSLASQDFRSIATVGRWRLDLGRSFLGVLYAGREIEDGGYNRVMGPDFQWRPGRYDEITAQALWSDTRTPTRTDLAGEWDGRHLTAIGGSVRWFRTAPSYDWDLRYRDFGDEFRADVGFVPQVGYREGLAAAGYSFYPKGFLTRVLPFMDAVYTVDRGGALINRRLNPGLLLTGRRNLTTELNLYVDRVLTADRLLDRTQFAFRLDASPGRHLPRLGVSGFVGEEIDLAHVRVGRGGSVRGTATLRPTSHLSLEAVSAVDWLDVEAPGGGRGRLFTAQVQRLKATYNFSSRAFLRLIGQYVTETRNEALYAFPIDRRGRDFTGSALFSYRVNWQTALFVGYGDARTLAGDDRLVQTSRELFVKLSYAFQR